MMGKVIMSGVVPKLTVPFTGILASELAVGSSVYLNEDGKPIEYLVVNQGIPSNSSLYDSNCDGTWLLRKDICTKLIWSNWNNGYPSSAIHSYLNGDFLALLDSDVQSAIKQVKIPISFSSGEVWSGSKGWSTKIFILSVCEVGYDDLNLLVPMDGGSVSYFSDTAQTDSKRIAYYEGTAIYWHTRSLRDENAGNEGTYCVNTVGNLSNGAGSQYGVRPALVLPPTALFDEKTLLFKGVS